MAVDVKIELTKLLSLHEAAIRLDHAARDTATAELDWKPFSPSRFIYSFFTFNSIYSFNWPSTIAAGSPRYWEDRRETEQAAELARFRVTSLSDEFPHRIQTSLRCQARFFRIEDPLTHLQGINPSNENRREKDLRKAFPGNFKVLWRTTPPLPVDVGQASLIGALGYIQTVRNNVFHGSKSSIAMADPAQQTRLLIYASMLNATCAIFFDAICLKVPGWRKVPANFSLAPAG